MARVLADRYEIGPTLGSGLQGKVKLATDLTTGEKVAVKLVDASRLSSRPKEKSNLEREIKAMEKLDHDNIVRLREVNWDIVYPNKAGTKKREVVMIVIDFAEGGELFDFMMYTGSFPEGIARAYFQQLIAGLEHCHDRSITHRDLKPENLLLSGDFQLKIADFGLSALLENDDGTPSLLRTECGTRGYMAPEVLASTPYRGEPADIWAAGVVLFISLAGFPPFQMATSTDWWFQRIRNRQYSLFWEAHLRSAVFSPGAMGLLNKIFVANPGERATIEDIKADPWFASETVSLDTLSADLTRRKTEVERQKRIAKEEEDRKKAAERRRKAAAAASTGGAVFDPFARDVHRSVGAEGKEVEVKPAPPLPADLRTVSRYTCFYSTASAPQVCARMAQAFSEMCAAYTLDEDSYKLKATIKTPLGDVKLAARVYACDGEEGLHMIDVRRKQGDMFKFQDVFKVLCGNLSDIITTPPSEEEETTMSKAAAAPAAAASTGAGAGAGAEEVDELI